MRTRALFHVRCIAVSCIAVSCITACGDDASPADDGGGGGDAGGGRDAAPAPDGGGGGDAGAGRDAAPARDGAVDGTPNPTLTGMADDTWMRIDSATMSFSGGLMAFSGGAFDPADRQMLTFGGGHEDYEDNDVWGLDLATLTWSQLRAGDGNCETIYNTEPSRFDGVRIPGGVLDRVGGAVEDAAPCTRHTYDTAEMFETAPGSGTWQMFVHGAVPWWGTGGSSSNPWTPGGVGFWSFGYGTRRWTVLNAAHGPHPPRGEGAAVVYDPHTGPSGSLWHVRNETWRYDIASDSFSNMDPAGQPAGSELSAVYWEAGASILMFGGEYPSQNTLYRYDIATNAWSELPADGTPPPATGGYGLAIDTHNHVLVAGIGGTIWTYDLAMQTWTRRASGGPSHSRIYGRFQYDPVNNVVITWGTGDSGKNTWAYKFRD